MLDAALHFGQDSGMAHCCSTHECLSNRLNLRADDGPLGNRTSEMLTHKAQYRKHILANGWSIFVPGSGSVGSITGSKLRLDDSSKPVCGPRNVGKACGHPLTFGLTVSGLPFGT